MRAAKLFGKDDWDTDIIYCFAQKIHNCTPVLHIGRITYRELTSTLGGSIQAGMVVEYLGCKTIIEDFDFGFYFE